MQFFLLSELADVNNSCGKLLKYLEIVFRHSNTAPDSNSLEKSRASGGVESEKVRICVDLKSAELVCDIVLKLEGLE